VAVISLERVESASIFLRISLPFTPQREEVRRRMKRKCFIGFLLRIIHSGRGLRMGTYERLGGKEGKQ